MFKKQASRGAWIGLRLVSEYLCREAACLGRLHAVSQGPHGVSETSRCRCCFSMAELRLRQNNVPKCNILPRMNVAKHQKPCIGNLVRSLLGDKFSGCKANGEIGDGRPGLKIALGTLLAADLVVSMQAGAIHPHP